MIAAITTSILLKYLSTLSLREKNGGARRDRTADLLRARQALSQLSYGPIFWFNEVWDSVSMSRLACLELLCNSQTLSCATPAQLSYGPIFLFNGAMVLRILLPNIQKLLKVWWVWVDLNHRPHPYQGCALTN